MIKAVIFDCFGVLYGDGKAYLTSLVSEDKRQELHDLYMQADYGVISGEDFTQRTATMTGLSIAELERMIGSHYVRNDRLFDYAWRLKDQYKIGLISNVGDNLVNRLFTTHEQEKLFDAMVLSSQFGVVKPAREIYEVAARQLDVLPGECYFTDDIQSNVDGAKNAGMHAALFTTNERFEYELTDLVHELSNA